jgi:hypothetical protein
MPRYKLRTLLIVLALGPMVLAQEKADPGEALYGEWEIIEVTLRKKPQVLPDPPVAWFIFDKGAFTWLMYGDAKKVRDQMHANKRYKSYLTEPCIIRESEIEVLKKSPTALTDGFTALYKIEGDKLFFVWNEQSGEKPTGFDAANDEKLALYIARKVK